MEISDTQGILRLDHEVLAALVKRVLAAEGLRRASISLALVDDASIHRVNRDHLHHDWPTDVISFTLSEPGEDELIGELVVSTETATTSALEHSIDPRRELALYVVHGLLHLCGYDDKDDQSAVKMHAREREILALEGLGDVRGGSANPGPAQSRGESTRRTR